MKKQEIVEIPVEKLEPHPAIPPIQRPKNIHFLEATMQKQEHQLNPLKVVERGNMFFIVDGIKRGMTGHKNGFSVMKCVVLDISDDEVLDARIRENQKLKSSVYEICHNVEHMLDLIGKSQGKKRESLGFDDIDDEQNFGLCGKDRIEITCILLTLSLSPSTLRKLMFVYWEEKNLPEEKKTGLLDLIDDDKISINKAYKLLKKKKEKQEEKEDRIRLNFERKTYDWSCKLFNKSSLDLSELEDNIIDISAFSQPYWDLKIYRNQGVDAFGKEKTAEEYINKSRLFLRELKKKLAPNGVCISIIGETYNNGYQSICTDYEVAIRQEGFRILDVNIWEKTNPRRTPHPNYFQPSHERIIAFCKKDANPVFNQQYQQSKSVAEGFKVKPSSKLSDGSNNYHMACDETPVTNVIRTSVFNKSEWENVDPTFTHDAPAPLEIYDRFISAYSRPGMKFLDIFCGSGQGLISGVRHGLNVIGYDIDPKSIEFCEKRIEHELAKRNQSQLSIAA